MLRSGAGVFFAIRRKHPGSLFLRMNDEEYCNLMLTLIHQVILMLDKMIEKIKEDFLRKGGIKEQMYKARIDYRSTH